MGDEHITISCSHLLDIADRLADAGEALVKIRPAVPGTERLLSGGAQKFTDFVRDLTEWELAFRAAAHDAVTEPPDDHRVA